MHLLGIPIGEDNVSAPFSRLCCRFNVTLYIIMAYIDINSDRPTLDALHFRTDDMVNKQFLLNSAAVHFCIFN